MPEICRFYGIVVTLNFNDHLPPHFHVWYGDYRATADIMSGEVLHGDLPVHAARLIREWVGVHRSELAENWEQVRQGRAPFSIAPLE